MNYTIIHKSFDLIHYTAHIKNRDSKIEQHLARHFK